MAEEILEVKNFAGIREARITLSRVNVFIGPQASGKSVCAKLLFFSRVAFNQITDFVWNNVSKSEMSDSLAKLFARYFPPDSWGTGKFLIRYVFDDFSLQVVRKGASSGNVTVTFGTRFQKALMEGRAVAEQIRVAGELAPTDGVEWDEDNLVLEAVAKAAGDSYAPLFGRHRVFIPAGRSLFSIFQRNIWSILTHELSIDPFLIEFGRLYQRTRQLANKRSDSPHSAQIDEIASRLLCGKYERDGVRDFIRAKDGRRTTLEHSSSGQQEALPLAVLLTRMAHDSTTWENSTVFVEEPEAHLYPSAQRDIVHLLATAHDLSSPDSLGQYVITTHSPYILTALNNLVYAGKIKRDFPDKAEAVNAVMDNAVTIDPSGVRAYMFADGGVESIIDEESQLVVAEALDGVSGALANEFQSLMDIEFGDSEE